MKSFLGKFFRAVLVSLRYFSTNLHRYKFISNVNFWIYKMNTYSSSTGCPKKKVSIKNFQSELLKTSIHSFGIYLDSVYL